MDTRQTLLKALAQSPDEASTDDIVMQLYDLYKVEKGIATEEQEVAPCEAHRRMGQWLTESYYFEMFRRYYPLPSGRIEYRDKPDVILHGKKKIGIEITNFYLEEGGRTDSEQRQRGKRDTVVSKAQSIYLENGGKRIKLFFSFEKGTPIGDRRQLAELAERIAKLAEKIAGRPTGPIGEDAFDEIPELSFVYLIAEENSNPQWQVHQVSRGSLLSREKLLNIVTKKESKARSYQRCDAYWLLVVVDFIDSAQDQEIRDDDFQKIDSSVFDKVIVYKTRYHHVLEAK